MFCCALEEQALPRAFLLDPLHPNADIVTKDFCSTRLHGVFRNSSLLAFWLVMQNQTLCLEMSRCWLTLL